MLKGEVGGELYELVPASGGRITCWFAGGPIRDEAGAIAGGVVLFRDVTEERRTQDELRHSEEKYRALFSEMDEAYAVIEVLADEAGHWRDFRFLDVNPAFMRHTGMPYPVGRTATELLGTPNPRWVELYGQALGTGVSIRVEESELALGRVFDLNIFRLGETGSRYVAVLFTDITERKQAEKDLRGSEERQRYLVQLGDALRPHADPATIQSEAVRVLGEHLGSDRTHYVEVDALRAEYVVQREWHRGGVASHVRRYPLADWPMPSLAMGTTWVVRDVDTDLAMPDDQRAPYRANDVGACVVVPLLKSGRLVATLVANETAPRDWTAAEIGLLEDTAERTWAAVEHARAEEALKENDRRKDEFLAMLGHELRNPLAPIRTVSALLDKQLGSLPEYQPLLGVLARQTMQITRIVDDLLDVARLTQGHVALKLESVECGAVIDQAIETVQCLATEKSHQVLIHRPGEKLYVAGDLARLVQTVTNLLHNAIKYTDARTSLISLCRASAPLTARKVGWASACPWPGTWWACTTGHCRLKVPVSDRAPHLRSDCPGFQPPNRRKNLSSLRLAPRDEY